MGTGVGGSVGGEGVGGKVGTTGDGVGKFVGDTDGKADGFMLTDGMLLIEGESEGAMLIVGG